MKIEIERDGDTLNLLACEEGGYNWLLCWLIEGAFHLAGGIRESELQINDGCIVLEE